MTRDDVIREARSWINTPWVHQASCKGVGADCIGFGAGAAAACGSADAVRFLSTPEWRSYGRQPDPAFLFSVCDQLMDRVPVIADALPGDMLLFSCGRHPMHFGFLAPAGRIIHSWLVARKVIEHALDDGWRARIVRVYRLRGVS